MMRNNQDQSSSRYKYLANQTSKADQSVATTLQSIRQNPKFARLLGFSINHLAELIKPTTSQHRENAHFVIEDQGHFPLVKALADHPSNDAIISSSCICLSNAIGLAEWAEEDIAKKIAEQTNVLDLIAGLLKNTSNKAPGTLKSIIELLGQLAYSASNSHKIYEKGLLELSLGFTHNESYDQDIINQAFETVNLITSGPQSKISIKPSLVRQMVENIEKNLKKKNVLSSSLRLLSNISRSKEVVDFLRSDKYAMQVLITILDNYPNEKGISNIATEVLGRIATEQNLDEAVVSYRSGNINQMNIVSSMVTVDDLMKRMVEKHAFHKDMIALIKTGLIKDKQQVIKNSIHTLGKLAEYDNKRIPELLDEGILDVLIGVVNTQGDFVKDSIRVTAETIGKLSIKEDAVKRVVGSGLIAKIVNRTQDYATEPKLIEATLTMLGQIGIESVGVGAIKNTVGIGKIVKLMSQFPNTKRIQEQGIKVIEQLIDIIEKEKEKEIINSGIINNAINIIQNKPDWKRANLNSVRLFDSLSKKEGIIPILRNANVLDAMVDILIKKESEDYSKGNNYPRIKKISRISGKRGDDDAEGPLNPKQESELKNYAISVVERVADPSQISKIKLNLSEAMVKMSKKPDQNVVKSIQNNINLMASFALIPRLGDLILQEDMHSMSLENARKILSLPEFEGKSGNVRSLINFFENLARLNNKELGRYYYQLKKGAKACLEFIGEAVGKINDDLLTAYALKAFDNMINTRIIQSLTLSATSSDTKIEVKNESKARKKVLTERLIAKEISFEKILENIVIAMRKFPDVDEVQAQALELMINIMKTSPELIPTVIKIGASRFVISQLQGGFYQGRTALLAIQFLSMLAFNPEGLDLLINQNALQAIMGCLSANRNAKELLKAANPLIQKISASSSANEETQKVDLEKYLAELCSSLNPSLNSDKKRLVETFELIGDFSLVDQNVVTLLKNSAAQNILKMLGNELKLDQTTIIEKGEISLHERILNSSLSTLQRFMNKPAGKQANITSALFNEGLFDQLIEILKKNELFRGPTYNALQMINNFLDNPKYHDQSLKKLLADKDLVQALSQILDYYKEDNEMNNETTKLLLTLSKACPDIANKVGVKHIIGSLIKETKQLIKQRLTDDDAELESVLNQNLKILSSLAQLPQNIPIIFEEGGVELGIAILKKQNNLNASAKTSELALTLDISLKIEEENKSGIYSSENISYEALNFLNEHLKDPEDISKLSNEQALEVASLLDHTSDPRVISKCLELLEKLSEVETIATYLSENGCVERLMGVSNKFPIDDKIKTTVGRVLNKFGAAELISSIIEQIVEISNGFDIDNPEIVDSYISANVYLGNLLTTPGLDQNIPQDVLNSLIKVIEKVLPVAVNKNQSKIIATQAVLISRLATREGENILKPLRSNHIIGENLIVSGLQLLNDSEKITPENAKLVDIILDAIASICKERIVNQDDKQYYDINSGKEIKQESNSQSHNIENDKLAQSLLKNDANSIETLLRIIDSPSEFYSKEALNKTFYAIEKLSNYDPVIIQQLCNKDAVTRLISYYEELKSIKGLDYENSVEADEDFKKLCKVLSGLVRTKDGYAQFIKTNLLDEMMRKLTDTPFDASIKDNSSEYINLTQVLDFMTSLCANTADKTRLIEKSVPIGIIELLQKCTEYPPEELRDNPVLLEIIGKILNTLRKLEKDPGLARLIVTCEGHIPMKSMLTLLTQTMEMFPRDFDQEKFKICEEIIGNIDKLDTAVENNLLALFELVKAPKYARELDLFAIEADSYQDMLNLISFRPDNTSIALQILKIAENSLKIHEKDYLLENIENYEPLQSAVDYIRDLYPKIPIYGIIAENIRKLFDSDKKKIEENNIPKAEFVIQDVLKSLKIEEEERKKAEEESKKVEEEKKKVEEGKNKLEEDKKKVEDDKKKVNEVKDKIEEDKKKVEDDKKKIEEDKKKINEVKDKIEEDKNKVEEDKKKIEEDKNNKIEEIETKKIESKKEIEIEPVKTEDENLADKIEFLADTIDDYARKLNKKGLNEGDKTMLWAILDIVKDISKDELKVNKMVQLGVCDSLIKLASYDKFMPEEKVKVYDTVNIVCNNVKVSEKYANSEEMINAVINEHKSICEKVKNGQKLANHEKKTIENTIAILNKIGDQPEGLANLQEKEIVKDVLQNLKLFSNDLSISLPSSQLLSKFNLAEGANFQEFTKENGPEILSKLVSEYDNDPELLRKFAFFIGKTATTVQLQTDFGKQRALQILRKGNDKYPADPILNTNCCFAYGTMVFNHSENSEVLLGLDTISYMQGLVEQYSKEPKLMENLSTLLNNLSFKNQKNKKLLGEAGALKWLNQIFAEYIQNESKSTPRQCLKAIGNLSLLKSNAALVVSLGFIKIACDFIENNLTESDIVKLALAVIGNIAVEDVGQINTMITEGAIDIIYKSVQAYELKTELLIAAIESLGNLIKHKNYIKAISEKGAMDSVLRILRTQDFNKDLVLRCLKVLSILLSLDENIDLFYLKNGYEYLNNLIVTMRSNNDVILLCFKLYCRIAIDKNRCKQLHASGVINHIFHSFNEDTYTPEIYVEFFNFCLKLSVIDESSSYISERGSVLIIECLLRLIAHAKVIESGVNLLANLLALNTNVDIIVKDKGIESLNKVVMTYSNNPNHLLNAFRGLSSIALHSEEFRQLCIKNKSEELVKRAYEDPSNAIYPDINSEGKIAYTNLITPHKPEKDIDSELSKKSSNAGISPDIRNFLIAGKIVKIYKKDGEQKEMHLFMTNDLKEILAKRPKRPEIKPQWRIGVHQIKEVKMGYTEKSAFAKHKGLFKKKPNPQFCFSVMGPTEIDGQKAFYVQSASEAECKRWYECLMRVIQDFKKKQQKGN